MNAKPKTVSSKRRFIVRAALLAVLVSAGTTATIQQVTTGLASANEPSVVPTIATTTAPGSPGFDGAEADLGDGTNPGAESAAAQAANQRAAAEQAAKRAADAAAAEQAEAEARAAEEAAAQAAAEAEAEAQAAAEAAAQEAAQPPAEPGDQGSGGGGSGGGGSGGAAAQPPAAQPGDGGGGASGQGGGQEAQPPAAQPPAAQPAPPPAPAPAPVQAPAPEPPPAAPASPFAFSTFVGNSGGQGAVDQCTGGVTYHNEVSAWVGKPYYPIHNHCGGAPILNLSNGDLVQIDGQTYQVVGARDVVQGDDATVLQGLPGTALLQTCYANSNAMRVVAIQAI